MSGEAVVCPGKLGQTQPHNTKRRRSNIWKGREEGEKEEGREEGKGTG